MREDRASGTNEDGVLKLCEALQAEGHTEVGKESIADAEWQPLDLAHVLPAGVEYANVGAR